MKQVKFQMPRDENAPLPKPIPRPPMKVRVEAAARVMPRYRSRTDPWQHLRAASLILNGVMLESEMEGIVSC